MRILVFAHRLEIGGTQTNAIELAATVRDQAGAEVVLLAAPGPSEALARARGLDVVAAPDPVRHPSLAVMKVLADTVRRVRPDVLHTWDWPQCFDAYYGEYLLRGHPLLCSVMGMVVSRFLPRDIPLTFGTRALAESARRRRAGTVDLLEPPVDLSVNAPGAVDAVDEVAFRQAHGIDGSRLTIGVVTRLTEWLKLESLLRTIAAVDTLASELPVRLVVAGDGPAQDRVAQLAQRVNDHHGAPVVVLTGALIDPRAAYQVSDVVVGMGGSALRAMAFAKPLVVLGERGFSRPLTEESAPWFLWNGWYGIGDGNLSAAPLASQLARLLEAPGRRQADGALGRRVVEEHYDLRRSAEVLDGLYRRVAATRPRRSRAAAEGARTAGLLVARSARGWAGRLARRPAGDAGAPAAPASPPAAPPPRSAPPSAPHPHAPSPLAARPRGVRP